jgi:hypothetical protein
MADILISIPDKSMRFDAVGTTWTFPVDHMGHGMAPGSWFWSSLDVHINPGDNSIRAWELFALNEFRISERGFKVYDLRAGSPHQDNMFNIRGSGFGEPDASYRFDASSLGVGLAQFHYIAGSLLQINAKPRSRPGYSLKLNPRPHVKRIGNRFNRYYSLFEPLRIDVVS